MEFSFYIQLVKEANQQQLVRLENTFFLVVIPSLSEVMVETQKLNINTDIEILRLHYAHTLSHWYKNVIENKDKIIKMFDRRFLECGNSIVS